MSRPRTKFPPARTIALVKDWPRTCRNCQGFAEAWEQWAPKPARQPEGRGRPQVSLDSQATHQAALFATVFVSHLRGLYRSDGCDGVERHLLEEKMEGWIPAVRQLDVYFRRDDVAWGEPGMISARRWKDDVQYQAVRRLLAQRLGLDEKTLRRRFDERDYWGESFQLRCHRCHQWLGESSEPMELVGLFKDPRQRECIREPRNTWRCKACGSANVFRPTSPLPG